MNDFDNLARANDNLAAMAESLNASTALNIETAQRQLEISRDVQSVAAIAGEMHAVIAANTEAMKAMTDGVANAALRAEDASNLVFERVEERAVQTLRDVDRAAKIAMKNSEASASAAVEEIERARKSLLTTTLAVSLSCAAALAIVFLIAVGSMWTQFQAGAEWLVRYGWLAIPVLMVLCAAGGYKLATFAQKR